MRLNLTHWIIIFALYGYWGWLTDSLTRTIKRRRPVNSGFITSPLMPFYGLSAIIAVLLRIYIENAYFLFLTCIFTFFILHYVSGLLSEFIFGIRFNDSPRYWFNINGRVSFVIVVSSAAAATLIVFFAHSPVTGQISSLPALPAKISAVAAVLVIGLDTLASVRYIVRFNGLLAALKKNRLYGSAAQARLHHDMLQGRRILNAFPNMRHIHYPEELDKVKEFYSDFA
jgi:uncharacterized membrane protein